LAAGLHRHWAIQRWTSLYFGIAMIDNFSTLIKALVNSGQQNPDDLRIPTPLAVEFDTEEAWQHFQASQISYDAEYATTLCGSL
jgi:hypothetical protein